jgi:transposase
MESTTFVGLDVHRKLVVATAMDPQGRSIRHASFGPTREELTDFLTELPGSKKVVLEACAFWERYYDAATSTGADVMLSHPLKTRMIAEASLKTDRVDSEALANLLRIDSIPTAYVAPPEIRALRRLVLERLFYTRKRTDFLNHIYARLAQRDIHYESGVLQHKRQRGQFRHRGFPEVDRALDALDDLEGRCKEMDQAVHAAFLESEEAQLLKTIPGIGELTAVALVAFLCPIERFATIDKLSSYVGLCPTTRQSADRLYHGKLKWDCNPVLRWLLVEVSWTHRVHARTGDVARYARRLSRRRGKMRGTVAGAHKLLKIIYAILKERRAYLPHAPERTAASQCVRVPRERFAASQ